MSAVRIAAAPGYPNAPRRLSDGVCRSLRQLALEQNLDLVQAAERNLAAFKTKKDAAVFHGLSFLTEAWHGLDQLLGDPECSLDDLVQLAQTLIRQAQPPGLSPVEEPELARLRAICDTTPRLARETPRHRLRRFLDILSPALHAGRSPGGGGLTLSTIDAAKGERWRIVFILDASDRTIPGRAGPHSDTRQAQRLFYIAVTRATEWLFLYSPADTGGDGEDHEDRSSRFLKPVRDQLDHERIAARGPGQEAG